MGGMARHVDPDAHQTYQILIMTGNEERIARYMRRLAHNVDPNVHQTEQISLKTDNG